MVEEHKVSPGDSRFTFHVSRFTRDPTIWALIAVSLAIRIGYNLALHSDNDLTSSFIIDEREYFGAAHMLAEGRGFSFFDTALWVRPPLYVMALAWVVGFAGTSYWPVLLLQSLLSAATLLPLGWLAWRIGGPGAARWSVALGAFFLPFTLFAGLLISETLFTFLLALTLVVLVRAKETFVDGDLRKSSPWLIGAGLLLGLSALTRATALGFVPLVAVWFALPGEGQRIKDEGQRAASRVTRHASRITFRLRPRIIAISILLAACGLTLVPWTVRNYAAYGKFVPLDTTGGYNLWLGSVGVRDEERLQADYRAIPNQADRQSYAYARAWENITADPLGFVGKGLKESLDLWKPQFSAEERQIKGYTLGRVPAWHLASLFVLDDLLYIIILCLAIAGLALAPPHSLKWLTGLWVLLWIATSFIFFAVTRFRLPIIAALVPWAGICLHILTGSRARITLFSKLPVPVKVLPAIALLAALIITVPELQLAEIARGMERWGQQAGYRTGETLIRQGDVQGALQAYGSANQGIADTRYALAAAHLQQGYVPLALSKLRPDEPPDRFEPAIIRGEAARQSGDRAATLSFFNSREVNVAGDAALQWAWDHLSPPPVGDLQLGSGLDMGYVRGFYGAETAADGTTFRWSGPQAQVRGITNAAQEMRIRWSGWRPFGLPLARTNIFNADRLGAPGSTPVVADLPNSEDWKGTIIELGASGETHFQFSVNPFIGAGNDPRLLGVRVTTVELSR